MSISWGLSYFLKKGAFWGHLTFLGTAGKTKLGQHTQQIQACLISLEDSILLGESCNVNRTVSK